MHINLPFGRRGDLYCDDSGELLRFYNEVVINQEYSEVPPGPHDVVIDLGANLGMFSLWIYDRAARIYAIEASDANYRNLVNTIQANSLSKITAFNVAIAGAPGQRTLARKGDCGGYNIMNERDPNGSLETVTAITLKTFLDENGIDVVDVLKIDVEGAEREIFTASEFSEIKSRIPYIIGEIHADYMGQLFESVPHMLETSTALRALVDHGYEVTSNRFPVFVARLSSGAALK